MTFRGVLLATALATVAALAGCGDAAPPSPSTAVLGGTGSGPRAAASAPITDSAGNVIPAPALPRNAAAQMVRSGPDTALAAWVQDDHVVVASYAPATGWSAPAPLEDIHGESSRPQLASNGRGAALAIWQHTVGTIQSLRFSRFDAASGWSVPDVMPGALPRPPDQQAKGADGAPQLHMDPQGNAFAQWPSGFDPNEVQTARFVPGTGWTRALSEPMTASAPQPGRAVQ